MANLALIKCCFLKCLKISSATSFSVLSRMVKLLNPAPELKYVDLIVSFTEEGKCDEDDDLPAPPVRYYFNS